MKTALWIIGGIIAVIVIVGVANAGSGGELESDRPTVSFTEPTAEVPPAPDAGDASGQVPEGMYAVGPDIPAGTYKTAGAADSVIPNCYYERLRNASGEFDAIIVNGNVTGTHTVTINVGEWFNSTGCQPWVKIG